MSFRTMFVAGALACATPAFAQTPVATPMTGTMTAEQVGMQPLTGVSATSYAELAADSNRFEIASSEIALKKSKRSEVKAFARMMIEDHKRANQTLMAALNNPARKIAKPNEGLSRENAAQVDALKAARSDFDTLYVTQQLDSHKRSWALQRGYADTGEDTTFKQIAATQVPVIERHLGQLQTTLTPTSVASR